MTRIAPPTEPPVSASFTGASQLTIEASARSISPVLAPVPLDGLGRRLVSFDAEGATVIDRISGDFRQEAYVLQPRGDRLVLRFTFAADKEARLPEWVWRPPSNALSEASPDLAEFARACRCSSSAETVNRLAEHVVTMFYYGAGVGRFTDGQPSVPLVCGTTRGTCIDIHTYFSAALRAAGIDAAYIAGIFLGDASTEATDMHCWVAIRLGNEVEEWDLSHALIASRDPAPGLTEIPGRRVALSSARGLQFATNGRSCQLSHLALPCDLDGNVLQARAMIEAL